MPSGRRIDEFSKVGAIGASFETATAQVGYCSARRGTIPRMEAFGVGEPCLGVGADGTGNRVCLLYGLGGVSRKKKPSYDPYKKEPVACLAMHP
jgi:hypothetical protein